MLPTDLPAVPWLSSIFGIVGAPTFFLRNSTLSSKKTVPVIAPFFRLW
jgi:hypothetical protein